MEAAWKPFSYETEGEFVEFLSEMFYTLGYTIEHDWRYGEFYIGGQECRLMKDGVEYHFLFSIMSDYDILLRLDNISDSKLIFRVHFEWSQTWKENLKRDILHKFP